MKSLLVLPNPSGPPKIKKVRAKRVLTPVRFMRCLSLAVIPLCALPYWHPPTPGLTHTQPPWRSLDRRKRRGKRCSSLPCVFAPSLPRAPLAPRTRALHSPAHARSPNLPCARFDSAIAALQPEMLALAARVKRVRPVKRMRSMAACAALLFTSGAREATI